MKSQGVGASRAPKQVTIQIPPDTPQTPAMHPMTKGGNPTVAHPAISVP